jgi:hypothetical protein
MHEIVEEVNRTLNGWFEYFKHSNKWTFPNLDQWVRGPFRSILRSRHRQQGTGRGTIASSRQMAQCLLRWLGVNLLSLRAFQEIMWPIETRDFWFWRGFGEGACPQWPVTELKRSQEQKDPLRFGYSIS